MDDGSKEARFVTEHMATAGAMPERGSPGDMARRDRMIELASRLADETRTVFYVGWSQSRWRWLVSNDREEMVRECLTMEALAPNWATPVDIAKQIAETDRRAAEVNQDPAISEGFGTVVRVLVYSGTNAWLAQTMKNSVVRGTYECPLGTITELSCMFNGKTEVR